MKNNYYCSHKFKNILDKKYSRNDIFFPTRREISIIVTKYAEKNNKNDRK